MPATTRLFTITFDKSKNSPSRRDIEKKTMEGTHYATGIVTLDNGTMFNDKYGMMQRFEEYGQVSMQYQDEEVKA